MISAIVLAAGDSTRLGRPKQLLQLEGMPLLQHVVDALDAARVDEIVVVLGHDAARIEEALHLPDAARIVVNEAYAGGQSTSLAAGLEAAHPDAAAALIVLGDQPRLEPWIVEKVIAAHRSSGASIVRARFGDVPGHPVLMTRPTWPTVMEITGDVGARTAIARSPTGVHDVQMGIRPLADVDTQEDFEGLVSEAPPATRPRDE